MSLQKKIFHKPVMAQEVISFLRPEPGSIIVDGTIGEGGHSELLAGRISQEGLLIGIDKDKENITVARERLSSKGVNFKLFQDSYSNMNKIVQSLGIKAVDGVLLDLGFSMRHIFEGKRGFSFSADEKLDMRYDIGCGVPAREWLNNAPQSEIENVLKEFGEEDEYRRIAAAIVFYRKKKKIISARELADIVSGSKRRKGKKTHPATRTFQAIRIYVNNEFGDLKKGLINSVKVLKIGKRLAVLTYHSLEDRIVKDFLAEYSGKCLCPSGMPVCRCGARERLPKIKIPKASGSRPSEKEIAGNPASRSAHLRGCEVVETVVENG